MYPLYEVVKELSPTKPTRISDIRDIYYFDSFLELKDISSYYSFLQTTLLPGIYNDFPTPYILYSTP